MKDSKNQIPFAAREYLSRIGRKGGRAGSNEDKKRAAIARWNKPGARKSISGKQAGE